MTYNTEQRNLLLNFLQSKADTMFSAKQIADSLQKEKISRSAVYRNLSELEAEGKVKRCTQEGSRENLYQYYDLQTCRNHIHLSCTNCGRIFHMESDVAQKLMTDLVDTEGFRIDKSKTTLYGLCKECQKKECHKIEQKQVQTEENK